MPLFKPLYCNLPRGRRKSPCRHYLCDIESGKETTLNFTCPNHEPKEINRIQYHQDKFGIITWIPLKKSYIPEYDKDDNGRIGATVGE